MRSGRWSFVVSLAGFCIFGNLSSGQSTPLRPRITQAVEDAQLTTLRGNTHPLAQPRYDRGQAPANLAMNRMLMVLQRSPEQESTLRQLLDDQQDKASPNYHKWLTPEQFGQQFGPADADIQTVTAWLQTHGFQVATVSHGRGVIEFSGTVAQVQEAFHTAIHKYVINGEEHWANASDPQIPSALTPVVHGVLSLHNFRARPFNRRVGVVSRDKATGAITTAQPLFTIPVSSGCGVQSGFCYGVGPYDFATIYDVLPLWNASPAINGAGETIAIVGETDINPQDVTDFRNFFGLPAANLQVIHDGTAPGILQDGEESESDLDVEWSGAIAPGATIDFVVAESTETTQGIHLAALHIVDNNLAPVMSESYGQCELFMGAAENEFFNQLWQQAAAQGITVMISTGDSGSAVCDRQESAPPTPAQFGLQVSGYSSTPYNIAVGGTDFNDLTAAATYWNTPNASNTQASAKGYIPEATWNNSCTNSVFGDLLGLSTNAETNCNNPRVLNFVTADGGSGGKSSCTASDGQTPASCTGGYPKPSWQTALTPHDGARDLPDVSLFAAANSPSGSFYLICQADEVPGACNPNSPTANFAGIGGTSASAPAFAGIMALVNQQTGARQGNANYVLYKLATQQPTAFHDVTNGTIAMPCQTGSQNCNTATSGDRYGILTGYSATPGYDLATGLGSVDAFNLVSKWTSVTLAPSQTTLSNLTPTTITHGQPVSVTVGVAPQSGTGVPAGIVALVGGPTGSVTEFDSHPLDANGNAVWTSSLLPGGTYSVSAQYPGDGNYSGSNSAASIPVTVNKELPSVNIGLVTFDAKGELISRGTTTEGYGSLYILRIGITGTTCSSNSPGQSGCPTGSVSLSDNGNPLDAGTYSLNGLGYTEDLTVQLSGGSHAIQASYLGDGNFNANPATTSISIIPATTTMTAPYNGQGLVGEPITLTTSVTASSSGLAPSGTVAFFVNGSPVSGTPSYQSMPGNNSGTAQLNAWLTTSSSPFPATGTYTITASYGGDSNYKAATAPAYTLHVMHPAPNVSIQPDSATVAAGSSLTLTATVVSASQTVRPTGNILFSRLAAGPIPGNVTYTTITDSNGFLDLQATVNAVVSDSDNFQASYSGDANYPASYSGASFVTVPGNDFALSFPGQATLTIGAGRAGQLTLGVEMQSGAAPVTLTAAPCSGLPAEATCSATTTAFPYSYQGLINVSTTAPHALADTPRAYHRQSWQTALAFGVAGMFFIAGSTWKRHCAALLSLLLIAVVLVLPSCGGGSSVATVGGGSGGSGGGGGGGGTTDPGTPAGTYTVTVTATSGTLTHTASFQLVVQ